MNSCCRWRHSMYSIIYRIQRISKRNILSESYSCDDAWQKRLESPLLKNIKMSHYFNTTDKKFNTKRLASGVDIDLFANCVKDEDQLEELEHLLYRFRKTKRANEMMDSTTYATVRALVKLGNSETLFRILENQDSYGVYPDFYCYNILMDNFLKQNQYKEAAQIAILMMLQEDFSNPISQILGLYSCEKFLSECSLQTLNGKSEDADKTDEKTEDDEEEVTYVRIPFLRNPWFDDHFDLVNPQHLLGKTFYLIGREMDDLLGRTYQVIGLAMYEKWGKAIQLLQTMLNSNVKPSILNDGVEKAKKYLSNFPADDDNSKEMLLTRFEDLFQQLEKEGKIVSGKVLDVLETKLSEISELEKRDIELQRQSFSKWESKRQEALKEQNESIDREQRLKAIEEKKEYLFWKEKLLFFFENEPNVLDELKEVEAVIAQQKSKKSVVDSYEPPEIVAKPRIKITRFMKLTRVKKI